MIFTVNDLTMDDRKINFPTMAISVSNGKHVTVKSIVDAPEEEQNEK